MRKSAALIVGIVAVVLVVASAAAAGPVGPATITLTGTFAASHDTTVFDLTAGDITLSYTIDMTGVTQTVAWETPWVEVGLRTFGYADYNPNDQGAWMVSSVGVVNPSPGNQGLNDKHNLSEFVAHGETYYDVNDQGQVVAPFGSQQNHGIWYNRDSVDPFQALTWTNSGVNINRINTGGIYNIVLTYHAINGTLGTVFATINGVQQGFYAPASPGFGAGLEPENYPAGLSFSGDLTQMQVFWGIYTPSTAGGSATITNLSVTVPDGGMTLTLLGCALVGLGALRRKFRS